jgi:catechol 2,3-dioxygenase-like lactoylglutathione lyase family enzyme
MPKDTSHSESIFISGIQQLGIGVRDAEAAFDFFRIVFGTDARIFDEESPAPLVARYTGNSVHERHVIRAANLNGGGALELWQYLDHEPLGPSSSIQLGDPGIFAGKIKSFDIITSYEAHQAAGYAVSELLTNPLAGRHYFLQGDQSNWFNVIDYPIDRFTYVPFDWATGGVSGAIVGVSDIERSIKFYRQILSYDRIVFDESGCFEDLKPLPGGSGNFRRVLLEMSKPTRGPFSQLLGRSQIELVQNLDEKRDHIYANRFSGDLGFFHLSYDLQGMDAICEKCYSLGHMFTVDSKDTYDIGEAGGRFAYIEDPDGTLIQFVETHTLPLMEPGLALDLRKRDPGKPIPRFILQGLRMSRVE